MGFLSNISKTFAIEPAGLNALSNNFIVELSVDELYFYVKEMLVDGEFVSVVEPNIESREDRRRLFIQVAMPRVVPEGLKIDLNGNILQIFAQRQSVVSLEDECAAFGVYINLPKLVEPESIKFELKNNVLMLMFKKRIKGMGSAVAPK